MLQTEQKQECMTGVSGSSGSDGFTGADSSGFRWGVVKTAFPLAVEIAGLEYRADELLINTLFATGEHSLQTGDQVICLPLDNDDSRYFILAKAVAV